MANIDFIEPHSQLRGENALRLLSDSSTPEQLTARGLALAAELGLKQNERTRRFNTGRGSKTAAGLYLSALAAIQEIEAKAAAGGLNHG